MGLSCTAPPPQNHPALQFPVGVLRPRPAQYVPGVHSRQAPELYWVVRGLYVPSLQEYCVEYSVPDGQ